MVKNKIIKIGSLVLALIALNTHAATDAKINNVYTEDKLSIALAPHETQFTIKLKSNPTTGYSWFLRGYDKNIVQPVKHTFLAPESNSKLMGAPGYEQWVFKVKPEAFVVPQQSAIRFVYSRPWESDPGRQVVFQISTTEK